MPIPRRGLLFPYLAPFFVFVLIVLRDSGVVAHLAVTTPLQVLDCL